MCTEEAEVALSTQRVEKIWLPRKANRHRVGNTEEMYDSL